MQKLMAGQILLIVCFAFYLVWWYRGFRPGTTVSRVQGVNGILLTLTAAFGVGGIAVTLIGGNAVSGALKMLLSMIVSIVVLSVGAPGILGSGLICLSVLLTQMSVPVEAISLVMGVGSLIGMFRCMSNCLGDVAVTSIVARSEEQMDLEVYRE